MSAETEFPEDVIAEIRAGRKVNAIKLLRERNGIGLAEAKSLVDAYEQQASPSLSDYSSAEPQSGIGRILLLVVGVGLIVGIYKLLT